MYTIQMATKTRDLSCNRYKIQIISFEIAHMIDVIHTKYYTI